MKWIRPSGSTIELADTPNLNAFAKSNGWKLATRLEMKTHPLIKTENTTFIGKIKQMLG